MKIQSLAVIFIIIILPISIIVSEYIQGQMQTLRLQISYDSKLDDATKTRLLNQLNTMSRGKMLVYDENFLKTKQNIEAQINGAGSTNTTTAASLPQDAVDWNKSHPDQQVTVKNVNGKPVYTTTAKIHTKYGIQQHTVNGSSIEDLGKQIAELKKKAAAQDARPAGNSGNSYGDLGRAMQH